MQDLWGSLEINNNNLSTCEYCGTQQTLPKLDDEKRVNLYDRANHFRRNNEFDKAAGLYEQILNEDPTDAEAYWSLVLCRYGIEYVEDPASHKRVPTVNRAQFTSIFDDDNYKSAIQYADGFRNLFTMKKPKLSTKFKRVFLPFLSRNSLLTCLSATRKPTTMAAVLPTVFWQTICIINSPKRDLKFSLPVSPLKIKSALLMNPIYLQRSIVRRYWSCWYPSPSACPQSGFIT